MRRFLGILFGAATQVLFLFTVWRLYFFMAGHEPRLSPGTHATNLLLAAQFGISHSLLLHRRTREALSRWISSAFYGCFFCVVTCVSLLATIWAWHESDVVCVRLTGAGESIVRGLFLASWAALFYSLALSGLGYQTGLTPWWNWVRRRPAARRSFEEKSLYRFLRHPIYLSFLGLVWFTPIVTMDRALLIGAWTVYIAVGSVLKDRRLLFYVGDTYRDYMARVPGYPLIPFGPLSRVSARDAEPPQISLPFRTSSEGNETAGGHGLLLQLDLDEGVLALARIDDVVLDAFTPEIRRAGLHLGEALALCGNDLQTAVHGRHDDVVVAMAMPAGVVAGFRKTPLPDGDAVVVDELRALGGAGGGSHMHLLMIGWS